MALISKASSLVLLFALGCSDEPELNELGLPYDRWLDRPVQVRLRSERPQRKCQARPHNQWIYSPKVNRNSSRNASARRRVIFKLGVFTASSSPEIESCGMRTTGINQELFVPRVKRASGGAAFAGK